MFIFPNFLWFQINFLKEKFLVEVFTRWNLRIFMRADDTHNVEYSRDKNDRHILRDVRLTVEFLTGALWNMRDIFISCLITVLPLVTFFFSRERSSHTKRAHFFLALSTALSDIVTRLCPGREFCIWDRLISRDCGLREHLHTFPFASVSLFPLISKWKIKWFR